MASDRFELIVQDFEYLENWQDRYGYIIDLGRRMSSLEEALRVPATKVEGCASQVWMVADIGEDDGMKTFSFRGDSDAIIVRGLIAVLRSLYDGTALSKVGEVDAHSELQRLGLEGHLSSQRSNGLRAMVGRIHEMAAGHHDRGRVHRENGPGMHEVATQTTVQS